MKSTQMLKIQIEATLCRIVNKEKQIKNIEEKLNKLKEQLQNIEKGLEKDISTFKALGKPDLEKSEINSEDPKKEAEKQKRLEESNKIKSDLIEQSGLSKDFLSANELDMFH